jgi:hypothetical protein
VNRIQLGEWIARSGSVYASWIDDDGEQHVLEADFARNAVMGDARTQR